MHDVLRGQPARPYVAILGGAKVSDKLGVIDALLPRVDELLIGGAMANTFLAAQGIEVGRSLVESDKLALARTVMHKADAAGVKLLIPVDLRVGDALGATPADVVAADAVAPGAMALDIGPDTAARYRERILRAKSVFWNGPMGLFENPAFAAGTFAVAGAVADCPGFCVVGGGDSVAAIAQANLVDRFDHVSTGGGASLEYLEGHAMPGLEALRT